MTVDMTVKIVDGLDRTLATFGASGPVASADRIGRGYVTRWNDQPVYPALHPVLTRADGFYVWDESGNLLTYG